MRKRVVTLALSIAVVSSACSNPTGSTEYRELAAERDGLIVETAQLNTDIGELLSVTGSSSKTDLGSQVEALNVETRRLVDEKARLMRDIDELAQRLGSTATDAEATRKTTDSASDTVNELKRLMQRLDEGDF